MKKAWTQLKDKVIGILVATVIAMLIGFGGFAFRLYDTIENIVPTIDAKVLQMQDTINSINKRPAKIEQKVGLMEKDIDNIQSDMKEVKQAQIQQHQDTQEILRLLIQIKNGYD